MRQSHRSTYPRHFPQHARPHVLARTGACLARVLLGAFSPRGSRRGTGRHAPPHAAAVLVLVGALCAVASPLEAATALGTQILADSPQGYWPLNEANGTTAYDASGYSRNGTYSGAYTVGTTGLDGYAVNVTAPSGKVATSYTTVLQQFSFGAWIKPSAYPASGNFSSIVDKTSYCAFSWTDFPYRLNIASSGQLQLMVSKGDDYSADLYVTSGSTRIPLDGAWHQVYATWNDQTGILYLDGAQVGTASLASPITIPSNSEPYTFGHAAAEGSPTCGQNTTGYSGLMAHVAIYSKVLAQSRILAQYCAGLPAACPGTPVVTSLTPNSALVGASDITITISGSNFATNATVNWNAANGTALASTWVSSTQMTATIPASLLTAAGAQTIYVTNPGAGGGSTSGTPFTITYPAPSITSVSPASFTAGTGSVTLTVTGANFRSGASVKWGSDTLATAFVDNSTITGTLSGTTQWQGLMAGYAGDVTVVNPDGQTSNRISVGVLLPPVSLANLSPSGVTVGAGATAVTLTGANFRCDVNASGCPVANSVYTSNMVTAVSVNGTPVTASWVSGTQLTATIPSTFLTAAGTLTVTVTNPAVPSYDGQSAASLSFSVLNPGPTLTAISPTAVMLGASATPISLTGSGFEPDSYATIDGIAIPTTYISSTQLQATIPAANLTTARTAAVGVTAPPPGGGSTATLAFSINEGLPTLTAIDPTEALVGSGDTTLIVTGSGFTPDAIVQWSGASLATTVVSSTQLTAVIPAARLATAGTATITVLNPGTGGGTSGALSFTVGYPVPTISDLSPSSIPAGSPVTRVTITGTGFVDASVTHATWNGAQLSAAVAVTPTQLQVDIPANLLTTQLVSPLTVTNAGPGGGTSNSLNLSVGNPVPALTSISPASVIVGAGATTLTATGTNFVNGVSQIAINGTTQATTCSSSTTSCTTTIPATSLSATGMLSITVVTPSPGGGTTDAKIFSINNPLPQFYSLDTYSFSVGSADATVTATGANFVSQSVVMMGSQTLATTFLSATQLQATIPASALATPGSATLQISTPGPGGGTAPGQKTIYLNGPSLASLSPNTIPLGSEGFTLTASGNHFVSGSVIRWNGTNLSTSFGSATQLTATVPASNLTAPATVSIVVFTPTSSGGASSSSQSFTVTSPLPTITGVSPSYWTAPQTSSLVLTISGTGFVAGVSTAKWGNGTFPTTVIDVDTLTMTLPGNTTWEGLMGGYAGSVTVVNPSPGGGTSNTWLVPVALPAVALTAITPASIGLNGNGNITLTGDNFACLYTRGGCPAASSAYKGDTVVKVNGVAIPATWISKTQMTATIPSSYLANAGTLTVSVENPTLEALNPGNPAYAGMGYGSVASLPLTVTNPVPTLSALSPTTLPAGSPAFTLAATGTNFVPTSVLLWGATALPTTYYSPTDIRATVDASVISAGDVAITVTSPAPGGGTSNARTFTVGPAAIPTITSIAPSTVTAGSGPTTLTVTGGGYLTNSTLLWNEQPIATVYVDQTTLQATLGPEYWVNAGTASFSVSNPPPATAESTGSPVTIANPSPVLTAVSPASAAEGSDAITLTLIGSNFVNNATPSVAYWNGTALASSVIDGSTLQASVPASLLATQGTATLTVRTPGPGGGTSASRSFDVLAPVPTISSISPASVMADATGVTLEVRGTGFQPSSRLNWGPYSSWLAPTYQDSTTLRFSMAGSSYYAFQLAGYTAPLSITTPAPGGGTSNTVTMGILYPTVSLTSVTPATTLVNGSGAITLTGNNFRCVYNGSTCYIGYPTATTTTIVQVNGTPISASWVNGTTMTAAIPSSFLTTAGTLTVTVQNPDTPGFGGGSSDFVTFTVQNPEPTLTSISPTTIQAGSPSFTLTATGTNFVSGSVITWGGEALPTVFSSATELRALVPPEQLFAGDVAVGVTSPGPGGGDSGTVTFRVSDPTVPVITAVLPASVPVGSGPVTLTVSGTGFRDGSTIEWNGVAVPTVPVDSATLQATLDSSYWVDARIVPVTVSNPFPATATSAPVIVSVTNPVPTLTGVSPTSVVMGSGDLTITLTGSGFVDNSTPSTVLFNGSALSTAFVDSGTLTAVIPATLLRSPTTATLTVRTAGPGGGTTAGQAFTVLAASPLITSVSPASLVAQAGGATLTVSGAHFVSTSVVTWQGTSLATTLIDAGTLRATLPAGSLLAGGYAASVQVVTPAPGGGTSNTQLVGVTLPAVTLTGISPSSTLMGSTPTLTVTGTNFRCLYNGSSCTGANAAMTAGTSAQINGATVPATWTSSTQLVVTPPPSLFTTAATLTLSVSNPAVSGFGGESTASLSFDVQNPVPALESMSPTAMPAGSDAFQLTVIGANFEPTSSITWSGTALSTSYDSATQLHATVPAAFLTMGTASIAVTSPAPGGGTSTTLAFTVTPPIVLSLTQISPASVPVGSGAVTLTLQGSGFLPASAIQWDNVAVPTEYVDATTLRSTLDASYWVNARTVSVTVVNPAPTPGTSPAVSLSIPNPVPSLTSISPTSVLMGSPDLTVTLAGSHFVANNSPSVVQWNGSPLATTVVSDSALTAVLARTQLAAPATGTVTVVTGGPGGGTSAAQTFLVTAPVPTISSLSPSSIQMGSSTTQVAIAGTNFLSSSVAYWNALPLTTVWVDGSDLRAYIPTAELASAGVGSVTVVTPAPGGGTSNALPFTVGAPIPTVSSIIPNTIPVGTGSTTLNVFGTGFTTASQVLWGGTPIPTFYSSPTLLQITPDPSAWAAAATVPVAVSTPAPGGGTSSTLTVTVSNPLPTLTSVTPTSAMAGSGSLTLTLTGSGFIAGTNPSSARWNGTPIATTVVNATTITAVVPASQTATPGTATVTVANSSPGGGTSQGLQVALQAPLPTLAAVSPSALAVGMPDTTVAFLGGNFVATSVVLVNGTLVPTTYVSGTELHATIPAADLTTAGLLSVSVSTPGPGGGTSASLPLGVIAAPTLSTGDLIQQGAQVAVPFTWSDGAENPTVDCGTPITQTIAGLSGQCLYSAPGSYAISGRVGQYPNTTAVLPSTVTIPVVTPGGAQLQVLQAGRASLTTNTSRSIPVVGMSAPVAYPVAVQLQVALLRPTPDQIGILDSLNLQTSRLSYHQVAQDTDLSTPLAAADPALSLLAGTSPGTTLATGSLTGYTANSLAPDTLITRFVLQASTTQGVPLSAELYLEAPVASGANIVYAPTRTDPAFPYAPAQYRYTVPTVSTPTANEPITYSWTAVQNGTTVASSTAGSTFIPTIPNPGPATVTLTLSGPFAGSSTWTDTVTVLPPPSGDTVTFGIVAPPYNSPPAEYKITPIWPALLAGETIPGAPTWTVNGTPAGAATTLEYTFTSAGTFTVAVTTTTSTGRQLGGSTTVTVYAPGSFSTGALIQRGAAVGVPVTWLGTPVAPQIDCGTTPAQVLSGPAVECQYTAAGPYAIVGVSGQAPNLLRTPPSTVTIPHVAPSAVVLEVIQAAGQALTPDLSGSVPVSRMATPSTYPVPVHLQVTTLRSPDSGVGILDTLDPLASRLQWRQVAQAQDLTAEPGSSPSLILDAGATADVLVATGSLFAYLPTAMDPTTLRTRFMLTGTTLSGQILHADAYLDLPVADGSGIVPSTRRVDPDFPYAPASYRYQVTSLTSATSREPLQYTWTAQQDGTALIPPTVNGPATVTAPAPGTATVTLTVSGPFAGTTTWTDTITVPDMPPPGPVTITAQPPAQNRPPALYRFTPVWPTLLPGERLTTDGAWTVDGQDAGTRPTLQYTLTTPGPHLIGVQAATTAGRQLTGTLTVDVPADRPPTASIDCSKSYTDRTVDPPRYIIRCSAVNASDPDGTVVAMSWSVPGGGQILDGGTNSFVTYSSPVPVDLLASTQDGPAVGVPDRLNLAATQFLATPESGAAQTAPVQGADPSYTGQVHLNPSRYTIALTGETFTGQPISASTTLTILQETFALHLGEQVRQGGNTVAVPVDWPAVPDISNQVVDCGTTPTQSFPGPSGQCIYNASGPYTITGRFTDGLGTSGIHTAPALVTITGLDLEPEGIVSTIGGHAVTTFTSYSFPVPVTLTARVNPGSAIAAGDSLAPGTATFTLIADDGTTVRALATTETAYTAATYVSVPQPSVYNITLVAQTLANQTATLTASLTLTQGSVQLNADALTQRGTAVALPIAWPEAAGVTPQAVDCGTGATQTFVGSTGECVYQRPGTYTVLGQFTDPLGVPNVHTVPTVIAVPTVAPGPSALRAAPANGVQPTHDLSQPIPVATYGTPTVYPVPVSFRLTFDPPAGPQAGIADTLDASRSVLYVKPVATEADFTAPIVSSDQVLTLQDNGDGTFQAMGTLSTFDRNSADPATWQNRIILQGQTLTGIPVTAELRLQGTRGDASQITFTQQRIDPIYPYPPTVYRYVTTNLHSPITGEPMTQTWTSSDGQSRAVAGDGYVDITFTASGNKSATMNAAGPLTGLKTAVDASIVIPPAPAAAIAFTTTVPTYNRPPATYRFAPNYPPLQSGEKLTGSPTWSVTRHGDPLTLLGGFSGTPYYYTFKLADSYDVVISQATSLRTLYGRTTVTVNPDQPPTATLDCSGSYIAKTTNPWTYVLSCKALNAVDPDGTIKSYLWSLPDLGVSVAGTGTWHYAFSTPQAVNVTLTLQDNSYATCAPCGQMVLRTSFDLRTLH